MAPLTPTDFISDTSQLRALLRRLRGLSAIAIDTESNSLHAYREQVCLVQISIPGADYLVDPLAPAIDMSVLHPLFADSTVQKVMHACEYDVISLRRDFGYSFANLFDTMWSARILGWPRVGLADILKERFGATLDKHWQRFNWRKRPLPPEAMAYARLDTHYLLRLRDLQKAALSQTGRWEEAREVFDELAQATAATREDSGQGHGFWRIKGAHDLDSTGRAVLRELYRYRDEEASRMDRPPFKVIGDQTLAAIARLRPTQMAHLRRVSGMTERQVAQHGRGLLLAVVRGKSTEPPRLPARRSIDPDVAERYERLREWRKTAAAERGVDPDVIVSNAALMALAHRRVRKSLDLEGIEGLGPWRRKTYGPALLRVLESS